MSKKFQKVNLLLLPLAILLFALTNFAQTLAPNAPGKNSQWATAGKQGIGTANSSKSKVWFTLAQGVMTEVYYPDVTIANVHLLQFVVVNPKTKKVETERDDATHQIKVLRPDSLTFQQVNAAKSGEWEITKTYITDVERDSVLINVKFAAKNKNLSLYVYYDPSLANSGMKDEGGILFDTQLVAKDNLKSDNGASVLTFSSPVAELTNGYFGTSDGLEQLKRDGKIARQSALAADGNVVQMAKILKPSSFVVTLSFAKNVQAASEIARLSSAKTFTQALNEYEKGWSEYVKTLRQVEPKYQSQFKMAAMQLKSLEDKTVGGANIASLTVPWGGGDNANENNIGGYHLVWSRDLYQVFTAYMALGDKDAAGRALDFLLKVQQKADGSFPQNSWLDGKPFWNALQMDEVAFPLIMAYQMGRFDEQTYQQHLKPAADFIAANGPMTPQERWEEEGGYSPSTIAAQIAGLVCAADAALKNGDTKAAKQYLKTADEWEANIEKWTATTTGKYGDGNYYLRITQNGKPDAGEKIELNNGAGFFDERDIVDGGFLELVRLGIKRADDPLITKSVKVIDDVIKVATPNGDGFYRYNHDGYGEMDDGRRWNWDGKYSGKGRLWTLLSGERGQYELAKHKIYLDEINFRPPFDKKSGNDKLQPIKPSVKYLQAAQTRLDSMQRFANAGLMIPEQVWDQAQTPANADRQFVPQLKFGEGTGSATPLAWSMAQFIRLAVNLQDGKNLDTPSVVYERYVLGKKFENAEEVISNQIGSSKDFAEIRRQIANSKASPMIVGNKAYFYYKGKAKSVSLAGDFSSWKPTVDLEKIEEGLFVKEIEFSETARAEYKMVVDGEWLTDPMNPKALDNGVSGKNSVLEMPLYRPTVWANATGMTKHGISIEKVNSKIYGEREVRVYVPEGLASIPLPVMYLQDGTDYLSRADAITIQRNLVNANKLNPFIMVFIDYKDRMKEYWASDDYAKYLATEVVPLVDKNYKTLATRENRYIFGASLGGVTSIWTALKYPAVFANIGAQSNAFWIDDERVFKEMEKLKGTEKLKFYIDDGVFEGVEDSNKAIKVLREKGFAVSYVEGKTGHNWTAWRDRLADAFVWLMN